ncbi:MAG TPA: copper chaperone PCu(A)C [Stellaceae bacterium]|nr:copper chaperone PCu(A)C [Stellaceae bacterium]
MQTLIGLLFLALSFATPVWAQAQSGPSVEIDHPWARATLAGTKTGAAYMTFVNKGTADDRVVGASTPVAAKAEIHEMILQDGVMKMRPVAALDLKPGSTTVLEPGKYHVMLIGLKHPLKPGDTFPLTLKLEQGGERQVMVAVESPTKTGGAVGGMGDMGDMKMGK